MTSQPIRVLVTGAAGQIGYSLVLQIAKGDVFGKDQPIVLVLLDIPPLTEVLTGVHYELVDCALPNLFGVEAVTTEEAAFKDIDYAFLVGAMPRKEGMERKDLLAANVRIFKSQGEALAKFSKPTVKVLVVGNPANTNALICAKYAASKIPAKNFSAMTRLDHNRAMAQVAQKCADGTTVGMVKNVIIWGNHSSTQFPDIRHAKIAKGGSETLAYDAVKDTAWIQDQFIKTVQKRGAVIIEKSKLSSAMSAFFGTPSDGRWVSMAVPSGGSYGIPEGLVFSFPITIDEPMAKVKKLFAEWTGVQVTSLRFLFDGRRVNDDDTPKSLEMEEDDVIEVYGEQRGGEEEIKFSIYFQNDIFFVSVGISKQIIHLKNEIAKKKPYAPAQQTLFRSNAVAQDHMNVRDFPVRMFTLRVVGEPLPFI